MLTERIADVLNKHISRRRFMNRASGAAFGALLGAVGLHSLSVAALYPNHCCNLVYPNSCPSPNCGTYVWGCCEDPSGNAYMCHECYVGNCDCNPDGCSYAEEIPHGCYKPAP